MALFFFAAVAEALTPKQVERIDLLKKDVLKLFQERKFDKAILLLNEVLALDPLDKAAGRYLVIARQQAFEPYCKDAADAYQSENYPKAIEIWDRLLKLNPEDHGLALLIDSSRDQISDKITSDLYDRAEKFLQEGNMDAAINELNKLLLLRPNDSRARALYSRAKTDAVSIATKTHYEQAEIYMKEKQYDRAIEEWRKVLRIDNSQEAASRNIANALREKMVGLYGEARAAYENGDYVSAREAYTKILADNPTDLDVKTTLARLDEVAKLALKIDEKSPAGDMMRKAIAFYLAADGNKKASMAAAWYAAQLSQSTLAVAVKDFLERKYASILSTMEGPVGDMNIVDQYLFAALNRIYEGRYDIAVQSCMIIIELQPENVLAWKRLGSAFYAIGKKDKARDAWERALKITPNDGELKQFLRQSK